MSPKLQWALAILAALIVLGLVLYMGRDVRSDLNGAPAVVPAVVAFTPSG
jgi:FtsH-binding integral membrane protein